MGIAHTRWATHGRPSVPNAHPQTGEEDKVFLVHNGIIENYLSLKEELLKKGHTFNSETDTEVLVHLIEEYYQGDLAAAVKKVLRLVQGTFGIALFHRDSPDQIVLARRGSPLILGIGEDELLAASDVNALIRHTNQVIHLKENELAILNRGDFSISDFQDRRVIREAETIEWGQDAADKKGFEHYMLKEIFEQPDAVENALRGRLLEGEGVSRLGGLEGVLDRLKAMERIHFVSCGTSYYAGLLARYIFEKVTDFSVEVEYASEFRYRNLRLDEKTAVLAISQSGETADTLAAIREAKRKGALCLGLVNVVGSTIAKETEAGVYNHAGPEIGVASTKVFLSQCVILTLMALLVGRYQRLSLTEGLFITRALKKLPNQLRQILDYAVGGDPRRADELEALVQEARVKPFLDRDVNAGLSGGEIKRSELLQLLATRPRFAMMDEPDSGVDLESLELVGEMVNRLFSRDPTRPAKRRAGLIITHTGHILNYVQADKAHIMLDGCIGCSGNPRIVFDRIRESGYEECVRCILEENNDQ